MFWHKKIQIYFLIVFLLVGSSRSIADMKKVAQTGFQFLKIGVGAKMAGQADAGIARMDDINAIFWNPAGLALMDGKQVMLSNNRWIADISQSTFAFGMNMGNIGTFGFSAIYMDYGTFYPTVRNPGDNGLQINDGFLESGTGDYYLDSNLQPLDIALGIAYAKQFTDRFWMGWQVKMIYENLGKSHIQRVTVDGEAIGKSKTVENKMTHFVVDFGTVYRPGVAGISIAMAFQHFGVEGKYQQEEFPMPVIFKIGVSSDLMEALNKTDSKHDLILSLDTIKPTDYTQRLHFGAEYTYLGMWMLRGGYKWNYDIESFAAGFGIKIKLQKINWTIDMSYTQTELFTSPLRFSLVAQF